MTVRHVVLDPYAVVQLRATIAHVYLAMKRPDQISAEVSMNRKDIAVLLHGYITKAIIQVLIHVHMYAF